MANLDRFEEAIEDYDKALELGLGADADLVRQARAHAVAMLEGN